MRFSFVFSPICENWTISPHTSILTKKVFFCILKAKYQNGNIWVNFWVWLEVILSNKQQKMSVPTDHPVVWLFCYIINTNKNRHLLLLVITTKLLIITVSRQFPHIRSLILSCWTGKRRTRLHLNWLALGSQELR